MLVRKYNHRNECFEKVIKLKQNPAKVSNWKLFFMFRWIWQTRKIWIFYLVFPTFFYFFHLVWVKGCKNCPYCPLSEELSATSLAIFKRVRFLFLFMFICLRCTFCAVWIVVAFIPSIAMWAWLEFRLASSYFKKHSTHYFRYWIRVPDVLCKGLVS